MSRTSKPSSLISSSNGMLMACLMLSGCAPPLPFLTFVPQGAAPAAGTITATATCPQGTTRLGGGFLVAPDNSNNALVVRGSFPSGQNGWTLEVDNTAPVNQDSSIIQVIAYCAQKPGLTLSAATVPQGASAQVGSGQAGPTIVADAGCAAPAVRTGGGYRVDGPLDSSDAPFNAGIQESAPSGNAWHVEFGEGVHSPMARLFQAFAVCTTGIPAGVAKVVMSASAPGTPIQTEVECNPGSYTTAGGFRLDASARDKIYSTVSLNAANPAIRDEFRLPALGYPDRGLARRFERERCTRKCGRTVRTFVLTIPASGRLPRTEED